MKKILLKNCNTCPCFDHESSYCSLLDDEVGDKWTKSNYDNNMNWIEPVPQDCPLKDGVCLNLESQSG